jgi:hypothetical protein
MLDPVNEKLGEKQRANDWNQFKLLIFKKFNLLID